MFPNLYTMMKNYLDARKEWVSKGEPMRSPEKIHELHEICKTCPHYQPSPLDDYFIKQFIIKNDGMGCEICGCFVNENQEYNKLAWATTKCPLEPPRWIEEPEFQPPKETPPVGQPFTSPPVGGCGCGGRG